MTERQFAYGTFGDNSSSEFPCPIAASGVSKRRLASYRSAVWRAYDKHAREYPTETSHGPLTEQQAREAFQKAMDDLRGDALTLAEEVAEGLGWE